MADSHGHGGPHGGPHGGFGGPHGGFGGPFGPRGFFSQSEHAYRARPIAGAKGFQSTIEGMSPDGTEIDGWVKNIDAAVRKNDSKKFKKIRSFFKGTASFITEPWHDNHHFMKIEMTEQAYKEHRITEEQYQSRMMKAQNDYLWFLCKSGMISDEQYEQQVTELLNKYDKLERTR